MRTFLAWLLGRAARRETAPEPPSLDDIDRQLSWMFPPAAPRHVVGTWLKQNGWTIWTGGSDRPPPGRVAWLCVSTG